MIDIHVYANLLHFEPLRGFRPICELNGFSCSLGLVGADSTSIEVESRLPRLSRLPVKKSCQRIDKNRCLVHN